MLPVRCLHTLTTRRSRACSQEVEARQQSLEEREAAVAASKALLEGKEAEVAAKAAAVADADKRLKVGAQLSGAERTQGHRLWTHHSA